MKLIGELQNSRGWKGFLDIMGSKAPVQAGSEQTGLGLVSDTSRDGDSSTSLGTLQCLVTLTVNSAS